MSTVWNAYVKASHIYQSARRRQSNLVRVVAFLKVMPATRSAYPIMKFTVRIVFAVSAPTHARTHVRFHIQCIVLPILSYHSKCYTYTGILGLHKIRKQTNRAELRGVVSQWAYLIIVESSSVIKHSKYYQLLSLVTTDDI